MAIHEENSRLICRGEGGNASDQDRTIPTDDEGDAALIEDQANRIAGPSNHRDECLWRGDPACCVPPLHRVIESDVPSVDDRQATGLQPADQANAAQGIRGTTDSVGSPCGVERDAQDVNCLR